MEDCGRLAFNCSASIFPDNPDITTSSMIRRISGWSSIIKMVVGFCVKKGWLCFDHFVANGIADEAREGIKAELAQDIGTVRLGGANTDA
jgi:hypothetical protein